MKGPVIETQRQYVETPKQYIETRQQYIETLTTIDSKSWDNTLKEIGEYDFFHMSGYHRLAELRGEGRAEMLVYREGNYVVAFPLLLRKIKPMDDKLNFVDATSVAGLAGPISSAPLPDKTRKRFHEYLQDYFEQNNIVSVYSRLNPVMNQPELLKGYGEVVEIGVTQSIDLTPPPEVQYARYRKSHRHNIRRLKRMGFVCEIVGVEYLDDFMRIYIQTMDKLNANKAYYYDKSYFEFLLREMSDVMCLFICRDGENLASAKICSSCCGIVESYLSGTANEYLPLAPAKLLTDAIRIWANDIGAKTFHMGGSVGGRRDSLSDYKMGFGAREHVYSTWRHVIDQKAYDYLCNEAFLQAGGEPKAQYFPKYRNPFLTLAAIT